MMDIGPDKTPSETAIFLCKGIISDTVRQIARGVSPCSVVIPRQVLPGELQTVLVLPVHDTGVSVASIRHWCWCCQHTTLVLVLPVPDTGVSVANTRYWC